MADALQQFVTCLVCEWLLMQHSEQALSCA
jgi:hypothetical protein